MNPTREGGEPLRGVVLPDSTNARSARRSASCLLYSFYNPRSIDLIVLLVESHGGPKRTVLSVGCLPLSSGEPEYTCLAAGVYDRVSEETGADFKSPPRKYSRIYQLCNQLQSHSAR